MGNELKFYLGNESVNVLTCSGCTCKSRGTKGNFTTGNESVTRQPCWGFLA